MLELKKEKHREALQRKQTNIYMQNSHRQECAIIKTISSGARGNKGGRTGRKSMRKIYIRPLFVFQYV